MTLKEVLIGLCFMAIPLLYIIYKIWEDWKAWLKIKRRQNARANKLKRRILCEIRSTHRRYRSLSLWMQHDWDLTNYTLAIKEIKEINESLQKGLDFITERDNEQKRENII